MSEELKKNLQSEIEKFKQLQKEYHKSLMKRQQLDSQLNENNVVKSEFDLLESGDEVFKLIGPALIEQDIPEAKENVKKRIEYITSEIKRMEDIISSLDKKQEVHRQNVEKYQSALQKSQTAK